jgi:FixJ family two-component response regulator
MASRHAPPARLLADVTMRGKSGVTLPHALAERGEHLPVILITAHDTEEMRACVPTGTRSGRITLYP